jgi:nucleoid-associated protein YgaU
VQSGDSLSKIAKHFYGDAQKFTVIARANDIANPDLIKVGEELEIPAA